MMINASNDVFFRNLVENIGRQLVARAQCGVGTRQWEEMYQQLLQANELAMEQIKPTLAQKYPDVHWLDDLSTDENISNMALEGDYWICDPIDRAINFLQGLPGWTITLCLVHDKQAQFALIYDPYNKEYFSAISGQSAFLNGKQVYVSQSKAWNLLLSQPPNRPMPNKTLRRRNRWHMLYLMCYQEYWLSGLSEESHSNWPMWLAGASTVIGNMDMIWSTGWQDHCLYVKQMVQ
jgi:myo-inositol-1(or 4)-monophosphatase